MGIILGFISLITIIAGGAIVGVAGLIPIGIGKIINRFVSSEERQNLIKQVCFFVALLVWFGGAGLILGELGGMWDKALP